MRTNSEKTDIFRNSDVSITRILHPDRMCWPEPDNTSISGEEHYFGGNYSYWDLRDMTWTEARRVHADEGAYVDSIAKADDPETEEESVSEELYESLGVLYSLDLGIASSVIALSAAGCIPFSSCNGGLFTEDHREEYPLVAFYARIEHVPLLLACAEISGCGLSQGSDGAVVLYGQSIFELRSFASKIIERNSEFRELHFGSSQLGIGKNPNVVGIQLKLI